MTRAQHSQQVTHAVGSSACLPPARSSDQTESGDASTDPMRQTSVILSLLLVAPALSSHVVAPHSPPPTAPPCPPLSPPAIPSPGTPPSPPAP
eukprot:4173164-Prymnesium_polylepis.1